MEPQIAAVVGFAFVLLIAIVAFMSYRDRGNKKRIATEIRRAGGEPLDISFQFVGYDRDNQYYNVQFTDATGRKHKTRCTANVWQNNLFWQQTPAELTADTSDEVERWIRMGDENGSSKEQIIADLAAENERLREQLQQAESLNADLIGHK